MPFAQWHYPFENVEKFNKRFPADFISEAIDQTRGWFYTLLAISTLLFEKSSFKNCLVLGHVGDKDGVKMSKHKGNVVDPWDMLDTRGADAVRWYFYTGSAPWLPSRFSGDAVSEAQRKYMGTLWNTYAFYVLYADIDGFNPTQYKLDYDNLGVMDRWILSRLQTLIQRSGRRPRKLPHHRAGAGAGGLRGRAFELVCAARPRALLGRRHAQGQGGRLYDAVYGACHAREAHCAVHAVHCRAKCT